jgi:hypothetical protein
MVPRNGPIVPTRLTNPPTVAGTGCGWMITTRDGQGCLS